MRIPMVMHCPELIRPGTKVVPMVANIDLAPTILEAAGLEAPRSMDGRSFLPLLLGRTIPWREELLYEYIWEWNFPMTPTLHALRTERYKFIRPHGLWDIEELYDLEKDPKELTNVIRQPEHAPRVKEMRTRLFQILKETGGMTIPLFEDRDAQMHRRLKDGTPPAAFPEHLLQR